MMRRLRVITALAVALTAVLLTAGATDVRAQGNNPYLYPANTARTCSGGISGPGMEMHVFGFRGPEGYCSTRVFYSNSFAEALECARAACPDCEEVEEITGMVKFGTAIEGLELLKDYCHE